MTIKRKIRRQRPKRYQHRKMHLYATYCMYGLSNRQNLHLAPRGNTVENLTYVFENDLRVVSNSILWLDSVTFCFWTGQIVLSSLLLETFARFPLVTVAILRGYHQQMMIVLTVSINMKKNDLVVKTVTTDRHHNFRQQQGSSRSHRRRRSTMTNTHGQSKTLLTYSYLTTISILWLHRFWMSR